MSIEENLGRIAEALEELLEKISHINAAIAAEESYQADDEAREKLQQQREEPEPEPEPEPEKKETYDPVRLHAVPSEADLRNALIALQKRTDAATAKGVLIECGYKTVGSVPEEERANVIQRAKDA